MKRFLTLFLLVSFLPLGFLLQGETVEFRNDYSVGMNLETGLFTIVNGENEPVTQFYNLSPEDNTIQLANGEVRIVYRTAKGTPKPDGIYYWIFESDDGNTLTGDFTWLD